MRFSRYRPLAAGSCKRKPWAVMVFSRSRMDAQGPSGDHGRRSGLLPLTLTAIGIVYGDIGTSPLYTVRECFFGEHGVPPTQENVLGVLSLIIYALVLVISVKYIAVVMRADNQGEAVSWRSLRWCRRETAPGRMALTVLH